MTEPASGLRGDLSSAGQQTAAQHREELRPGALARMGADWPGWLAMVVAAVLYWVKGFGGSLDHDPGVYLYGAEHVARGSLPYLSLMNRSGPLGQLVPGAGIWLGAHLGISPVIASRLTMMVISVAAVGAAYLAARLLWSSRIAGTVAAFGLISFRGFSYYATEGPREKTLMVFFMLIVLVAMAKRAWLWSGIAIALATLTWQPSFIFTMAGVLLAIALGVPGWSAKLRALARVVVGGLATTLLMLLPYVVTGHLQAFINCFIVVPTLYTHQAAFFDHPAGALQSMQKGFGISLPIVFLGIAAMLAGWLLAMLRARRAPAEQASVLGAGLVLASALTWSVLDFQGWPDLVVLLASAAVGLGWLATDWWSRRADLTLYGGLALTIALGAVATAYALNPNGSTGLAKQRAIVDAVFGRLPADTTILSDDAPQWMAVAEKTNLTDIQTYDSAFRAFLASHYPGGYVGYQQAVRDAAPQLVIHGITRYSKEQWIQDLLVDYDRVGTTGRVQWWVSKSVDAATRDEIRAALAKWETNGQTSKSKNG